MKRSDGNAPPGGGGASGGEHPFGSTPSEFVWRKVRRPPEATVQSGPKGHRWRHRLPWDRRKPLPLTVKYRGGAEAWIEVHSRGDFSRFPGSTALIDVCEAIWRDR